MASFLALYRGASVGSAKLVAVSADPELVADFADRLLEQSTPESSDSVADALEEGRRRALQLVRDEAGDVSDER